MTTELKRKNYWEVRIHDRSFEDFFFTRNNLNLNLIPQVLVEQGLGKYCDPDFVRTTSREIAEALDMTSEEMDRAAHNILSSSQEAVHEDAEPEHQRGARGPPRRQNYDHHSPL